MRRRLTVMLGEADVDGEMDLRVACCCVRVTGHRTKNGAEYKPRPSHPGSHRELDQAQEADTLDCRRVAAPTKPKPKIISAQLAGSGTPPGGVTSTPLSEKPIA